MARGTHEITGDAALLTFDGGPGAPRSTLKLHAPAGEVVTETTSSLMANSTTWFNGDEEPLVLPGLFRRRFADTMTTEQIAVRLKDRT